MNAEAADFDPVTKRRLQTEFHSEFVPTDAAGRFCSFDGFDVCRVARVVRPGRPRAYGVSVSSTSAARDISWAAALGQITFRV
jgi:hypothetical protein